VITLITGGARSGKSRYALQGVGEQEFDSGAFGDWTYIATAELLDDEMRERAARHQHERGGRWRTIEEPFELVSRLRELKGIVVVDCLTMWLSNWMSRDETQMENQIDSLCAAFRKTTCHVRAITNEVGSSIVPENPLARRFRDWSGVMNQRVAASADAVYLLVCGLALRVK
jgi:adenosylcobinamide kinase/adenosylcobinamide-phosphate guanylyltransferase